MFAYQLISNEIFALKPSDLASSALVFMEDWQVKDLPVVQNSKILGIVNELVLIENSNTKVADILSTDLVYCLENTHFYDVLKLIFNQQISSISVVDFEMSFKGIIAAKDLAKYLYEHSSLKQEGGIIVLQMNSRNYSLAEIARITEINSAKILYAHVTPLADEENNIHVSLKYNVIDLKYIAATFERFGYLIIFNSQQLSQTESSNERFDWLIKYLNT
ncbi:MAG: CBS domain-containing protein [Bacteroidota bacterium]|jgi:CBS-domain-containing membrane protein